MPPIAIVRVTLTKLEILSESLVQGLSISSNRYVLAFIGARRIGRSRVIPFGATEFDFGVEPGSFAHEVRVQPGQDIKVRVEIWADDDPSSPLAVLEDSVPPPWRTEQRRPANELALTYEVLGRAVPSASTSGVAPRAAAGTTTRATLRIVDTVVAGIAGVRGLYEPDPQHAIGAHAAKARDGYISEDDRGRIYLNRDLAGAFHKDLQLIELHAKLTVVRGHLRDGAKVRWTVSDPDDPSNDDPGMHPEAGIQVDRLDYDGTTGLHTGARGFDNEGTPDRDPRWEAVPPFALEILSELEAHTSVVGDESRVIVHCPNVAGDNLIVRADVITDADVEVFAAETGVMTMWHRLDVEYVRMKSAFELPVTEAMRHFEPAFAQLDCTVERVVPDAKFIGLTEHDYATKVDSRVTNLFQHAGQGGWFCLVAALEAFPVTRPGAPLFEGSIEIQESPVMTPAGVLEPRELIDIPGSHPDAFQIKLRWESEIDGAMVPHSAAFFRSEPLQAFADPSVSPLAPFTRLVLSPHDYLPLFFPLDMGLRILFLPRHQSDGVSWKKGGYEVPAGMVDVTVESNGERPLLGQATAKMVGGKLLTTGGAVVFTHAHADPITGAPPANFAAAIAIEVVHELTHCFESSHKCGNWDHRTARTGSCAMNYSLQWLLKFDLPVPTELQRDTGTHVGIELCGRHIRMLRRTHLEDNPALGWG